MTDSEESIHVVVRSSQRSRAAMAYQYCQPRYAPLSLIFITHDSLPPIRKRSHSLAGGYIPRCFRHLGLDIFDDEETQAGSEAGEREDDGDDDYERSRL